MNKKPPEFWDSRNKEQVLEALALANKPFLKFGPPIPFGEGRPDRDEIISPDDLTNLSIALGTAESLENFLEMV